MARISYEDIDKYQNSIGGEFFKLENDGDTATVHFLVEDQDDLDILVVHKIRDEKTNKFRYVSCLRQAGDPIDTCPLCEAGMKVEVRLFLQLLDLNDDKIKIWDRGKTFINSLLGFIRRIKPLYSRAFDIERKGKKGDKKTTYNLYPLEITDVAELEEMPERVEIIGQDRGIVLDKSYEELQAFLKTGTLGEDSVEDAPDVRARVSRGTNRPTQPQQSERQSGRNYGGTGGNSHTQDTSGRTTTQRRTRSY